MFDFLFDNDNGEAYQRCLDAGLSSQKQAVAEYYQKQINELKNQLENLRNINQKQGGNFHNIEKISTT